MSDTWTIQRVLDWTRQYLERHGDEHPRLSAEWLLSSATGKSRVELYLSFDQPLEPAELASMRAAIQRRAAGEPLQYVTGEMPFRHIVLKCARGVLIPRPETEVLVDAALEAVDAAAAAKEPGCAVRVADTCSGTGCIGLSIAQEREGAAVWLADIADEAVELSQKNRAALGLEARTEVSQGDLFDALDAGLKGTLDVIVSNPPYVPSALLPELPPEVADFEPHLALDGGDDGLDVVRRIVSLAPAWLAPTGTLALELYENHTDQAAALFDADAGWDTPQIINDLTGRPRVLVVKRVSKEA